MSGGSYLTITFRKKGGELDAYMVVDKGQMLCGVRDCKFNLRVDDGQVQQWTGIRSSSGESDIMFVRDAARLQQIVQRQELNSIKRAQELSSSRQQITLGSTEKARHTNPLRRVFLRLEITNEPYGPV